MPPKRRAPQTSTAIGVGVKRVKTRAEADPEANAKENGVEHQVTATPGEEVNDANDGTGEAAPGHRRRRTPHPSQPAHPRKPTTSPPVSTEVLSIPKFLSFEIPGKSKPLTCRRSVHSSADISSASASAPSHSPRPPDLIFTHGAGGDLSAPKMISFSYGFASTGSSIVMFQGNMNVVARSHGFGSVLDFERSSSREEASNATVDQALSRRTAFGGRSMGARAAVLASQAAAAAAASGQEQNVGDGQDGKLLVLASYPLVGPKGDLRDAILVALPEDTRVLFISGDHDNMCPLTELKKVRDRMKARSWLVTVIGADHGMEIRGGKALKKGAEEMSRECGRIASRWLHQRDDGVREMSIRWDGDREKVLGTWGDDKVVASREKVQGGRIEKFFSKPERGGTKDATRASGTDDQGRKSKKLKR